MSVLAGKRILVVEDSPVVADVTEQILQRLGCIPVGPAPNMAFARELAEHDSIDAAIVDIRIRRREGLCHL
jgi:CheY-like chemotaxis protein